MLITSLTIALLAVVISVTDAATDQTNSDKTHRSQEFCNGETFRPRCVGGKHDVIVILAARYGRMSTGRCLETDSRLASLMNDQQFLGCFADVKEIIDRHCSGKTECDVRINDQNFEGVKPCYNDLKMHLEASYTCVQVAEESRHCVVPLTESEPQHIVGGSGSRKNAQTEQVGCGDRIQPWSIDALAGQQIMVSLIDFDSTRNASSKSHCRSSYGYILDSNSRQNVSICGDQDSQDIREQAEQTPLRRIYVSSSNRLQIITKFENKNNFILRVTAVGCSDLAPPSEDAFLKRVGTQIFIRCYMTRQSWQLNCVDGIWVGTIGVCSSHEEISHAGDEPTPEHQLGRSYSFRASTETAALAAVASAGVALCCLVICVGVLCLRRQQHLVRKKTFLADGRRDCETHNDTIRLNTGLVTNTALH